MATLTPRDREVFGSCVNLAELQSMDVTSSRLSDSRMSSRDTEVFEVEAAIEMAAADAKMKLMQVSPPAFPAIESTGEAFHKDFVTKADVLAAAKTPGRGLSARDLEVCEDAAEWVVESTKGQAWSSHGGVRRASGRDDEY